MASDSAENKIFEIKMFEELAYSDPKHDDEKTKTIVDYINNLVETSYYKTAVDIGEYILLNCFNDDPNFARSRNPKKAVSFNKLENHQDLKIKSRQLNQFLNIAIQERLLKLNFVEKELELLSYSHRVELLPIKDPKLTVQYAKDCIDKKWSVRQLRDEISPQLETSQSDPSRLALITAGIENLVKDSSVPSFEQDDFKLYSIDKLETMISYCDNYITNVETIKTNVEATKTAIENALQVKKSKKAENEAEKKGKQMEREKKKVEREAEKNAEKERLKAEKEARKKAGATKGTQKTGKSTKAKQKK